jgi:GNAT superfamily N-acetyltransferase
MLEIDPLPPSAATEAAVVDELVELVNAAYDLAEAGLWAGDVTRTSTEETATAIAAGQVLTARLDGRLAGAVRTRRLDEETGWIGVLAVDPRCAGRGVASRLVAYVEDAHRQAGATWMQLEVLVPEQISHAHTDRLAAWYARLGYRRTGRLELDDVDPASAPFRAVPLAVAILRKPMP